MSSESTQVTLAQPQAPQRSPAEHPLTLCVVLCTYNGARYLDEQLSSIALQTEPPDRMVIVDDGSSDHTVEIATRFARGVVFPVQIEVNTRNLGFARNFEKAISLAHGDIIVLSDQDDVWSPCKLSKIASVFLGSPTVGLVFSDADLVGADLAPLGCRLWDAIGFSEQKQAQVHAGQAFDLLLRWGNVVTGATMAFRGSFKDLVLPVEGGLHDAWIALLISAVADVALIPEPLIQYRQHPANQIGAKKTGLMERITSPRPVQPRDLERLSMAFARLERCAGVASERMALLKESIDHLAARLALPRRRVLRAGPICRDLLNGRYHRLSNGLSTAVKDLACYHEVTS